MSLLSLRLQTKIFILLKVTVRMISGSKSPGHEKLLLLIFMLKSHETGLTLPHAYEEIKGDMGKMQMRQQPETIKEQKFKKRSPCSLQQ